VPDAFIDVGELARRKLVFDARFADDALDLPHDWKVIDKLSATGEAELMGSKGVSPIRVRGRLNGQVANHCGRCLEPVEQKLDGGFELLFYPMSLIAQSEETTISRDETEAGFYEEPGMKLVDVVREQVLLWLPMSALCKADCQGVCTQCGVNRNRETCNCRETETASPWDALKNFKIH